VFGHSSDNKVDEFVWKNSRTNKCGALQAPTAGIPLAKTGGKSGGIAVSSIKVTFNP
jgi:hypothetical protein